MSGNLHAAPRRPRPDDFGLTDELVRSAPRSVFGSRQGPWIVGLWVAAALLLLAVLLAASGSVALSVGLTVVGIAAASVLLLPAIAALVCGLELCERCVLCRRHRHYAALLSYRQAIEEYESASRRWAAASARSGARFWNGLPPAILVQEVARLFELQGLAVERLPAGRTTGFDLLVRGEDTPIAVRCEAGAPVEEISLGHEIEGARSDLGVERVILVAPAGASADLERYLERHGGSVLDAGALDRMQRVRS